MEKLLKVSTVNKAFDRGSMALDVLLDEVIGADVVLEFDEFDRNNSAEWLIRVGAKSVTINPDLMCGVRPKRILEI